MGLDDFTSDDTSSSSSSSTSTNSSSSSSSSSDEWDGSLTEGNDAPDVELGDLPVKEYNRGEVTPKTQPVDRNGVLGSVTMRQLHENLGGTIDIEQDDIKYHLPMFPVVTFEDKYEYSTRYGLNFTGDGVQPFWDGRVVTCFGGYSCTLGELSKELVSVDQGSADKGTIMQGLRNKSGKENNHDTKVWVTFFGDTIHNRDIAQANSLFREGNLIDRDKFVHKILHPNLLRYEVSDMIPEKQHEGSQSE